MAEKKSNRKPVTRKAPANGSNANSPIATLEDNRSTTTTLPRPQNAGRRPSVDEIRERAYYLFLERGAAPGRETEDWLQAEREMCESR